MRRRTLDPKCIIGTRIRVRGWCISTYERSGGFNEPRHGLRDGDKKVLFRTELESFDAVVTGYTYISTGKYVVRYQGYTIDGPDEPEPAYLSVDKRHLVIRFRKNGRSRERTCLPEQCEII